MIDIPNIALIVEGGGMRNTYLAGIATAMMEAGLRFPYYAAVSAGATIVSSMLSQDPMRLRRSFVDLATDPNFAGWKHFAKGEGFFNSHYIYEETIRPGGILSFNNEGYLNHPGDFAIGAFRRDLGGLQWWHRADVHSPDDLGRYARASSSLPILMPPTWIDGVCYVDGGLGESIPISPAIAAGYDRFIVLRSQERGYRKQEKPMSRKLKLLAKTHPMMAEAMATRPRRYNEQITTLEQLAAEGKALLVYPDAMPLSRTDLAVEKLAAAFAKGLSQGRRERPRWLSFIEKNV